MNKKVFTEGMVIFIVGVVTFIEGVRLTIMEKIQLYDVFGPGNYTIGIGSCLVILSIIYILSHCRDMTEQAEILDRELKNRLLSMIGLLAIYAILMNLVGYLLSTLLFFLLIFRVAGFKSWPVIVMTSVGVTGFLYIVFQHWLRMPLPRGMSFMQ